MLTTSIPVCLTSVTSRAQQPDISANFDLIFAQEMSYKEQRYGRHAGAVRCMTSCIGDVTHYLGGPNIGQNAIEWPILVRFG